MKQWSLYNYKPRVGPLKWEADVGEGQEFCK